MILHIYVILISTALTGEASSRGKYHVTLEEIVKLYQQWANLESSREQIQVCEKAKQAHN